MDEAKTSYKLPELTYATDALEPVISKEALELHYFKHHQGYVNNLNLALDKYHEAEAVNAINAMVEIQSNVQFNGGGHINHSLFWENLAPISSQKNKPDLEFLNILKKSFFSFEKFKEEFNEKAVKVKGSGWAWLGYNKLSKALDIITTQNHETISYLGLIPLLIVDVWEHAYYLQYRNERKKFLDSIWDIINFEIVKKRYLKAIE